MATVYVNGTVYTMRHEGDKCTAFVVDDGKFMYCGTDEGARAFWRRMPGGRPERKDRYTRNDRYSSALICVRERPSEIEFKEGGIEKRTPGNDQGKGLAHTGGRMDPWNWV